MVVVVGAGVGEVEQATVVVDFVCVGVVEPGSVGAEVAEAHVGGPGDGDHGQTGAIRSRGEDAG
jgi:hypothetical protein